jgi:sulfite oxidase
LDRDFEKHYGASIPWTKAVAADGDVILAYEMNGQTLPRDHGFPVRAVVPGIVGARNVKWLSKIHASKDESPNHWQQLDYKGFCPSIDWHNVDFKSAPAIQELPVQSAITQPVEGYEIAPDAKDISMKGFAWSGGGRGIVRVDVSADGGANWTTAELSPPENQKWNRVWGWTIWKADLPVPPTVPVDEQGRRKYQLIVKAVDSSYNTQPDTMEPIWNLRGVLANAWHRVNVYQPKDDTKTK